MATVHGIRLIVSWNFRHLVNIKREDAFNAVNLLHGWTPVRIVNPKELVYAESRKWKETVALETKGMTIAERMVWFRRHSCIGTVRRKKFTVTSAHST